MFRLPECSALFADAETLDQGTVALNVDAHEVVEQISSLANHLQQAAAAVVILLVGLQVLGEVVDSLGENGNLNLRGTRVALVGRILFDNCGLFFLQHGKFHLSVIFSGFAGQGR